MATLSSRPAPNPSSGAAHTPLAEKLRDLRRRGLRDFGRADRPVFIEPGRPFWFVPSALGGAFLQRALAGHSEAALLTWLSAETGRHPAACAVEAERFLAALALPAAPAPARPEGPPEALRELWLHVTEACNLRCTHCLFHCRNREPRMLSGSAMTAALEEARGLGARLACFTGGEPLLHPAFPGAVGATVARGMDAAVLTNAIAAPETLASLRDLPRDRVHFQVSLDGPRAAHDATRGAGAFDKALRGLDGLRSEGWTCSAAMSVHPENAAHMADFVNLAADLGLADVHFMWHIPQGVGSNIPLVSGDALWARLRGAIERADERGVTIDNVDALAAQVFTPPGTRFGMTSGGWEALAIGPDGGVYPAAALVDCETYRCGELNEGLETVWRDRAPLRRLRRMAWRDAEETAARPWGWLVGGGDIDHCLSREEFGVLGPDPYAELHERLAVYLIEREAEKLPEPRGLGLRLRMGDVSTECPSEAVVNFTHSNCLLSLGGESETRRLVRDFYAERAREDDQTILNPVQFASEDLWFIPEEGRVRGYGCGSPVQSAALQPGETVADLGCGAGVECFLAAEAVGAEGRVYGVDMTEEMLERARASQGAVAENLGYANTEFLSGYLEELPLEDDAADVVISNCVVNLTHNKRRVFSEIRRVLRPGGRLVIADVVAEEEPPLAVRADHDLVGECIGGALAQSYLFQMLWELGFEAARALRRFPYRVVQEHPFYSLTFTAQKPAGPAERSGAFRKMLYGGPLAALLTESGQVLRRGEPAYVWDDGSLSAEALRESGVLLLDPENGAVTNADMGASCCCAPVVGEDEACCAPEAPDAAGCDCESPPPLPRATGCLLCGEPLTYADTPEPRRCALCNAEKSADAWCGQGHFVCDACHANQPLEVIRRVCLATHETDMLALFNEVRAHPAFPLHGPEHHALVPGVILATYRNLGGAIEDRDILEGIERGSRLRGGDCAFIGACGAATGCGVALSVILEGNPLRDAPRQQTQWAVSRILARVAEYCAARCCQRDATAALEELARLSGDILPIRLIAVGAGPCEQSEQNDECIAGGCPLFQR